MIIKNTTKKPSLLSKGLLSVIGVTSLISMPDKADAIEHENRNYGYLYWENGYPSTLSGRRPQSQANTFARANPNLIIQTGYYSLKLDYDDMDITGNNNSSVLAHFTMPANKGIGHIPVIVRDVNSGQAVGLQINDGRGWEWLSTVSSGVDIETNNYYQGVKNSSERMDYCFNVQRTNGLSSSFQVRVLRR